MKHPTDFDDLRSIGLRERDRLLSAAILPHLPDGDALVRIKPDDERPLMPDDDTIDRFAERVDPIAGGANLRRVAVDKGDPIPGDQIDLKQSPHGIRSFRVSVHEVDVLASTDDEYDFDDTDQTALADFGVTTSPVDAVHLGVTRTDDTFERKPTFPA